MKIEKAEKLESNLDDKEEYVILIRNLKQALNHGLVLKKVHRVIEFNQKALLKPYIDMNTRLRKKAKNDFEKDFFKLMNNAVLKKSIEMCENTQLSNLKETEKRSNYLDSDPNYQLQSFSQKTFWL